MFGVMFGVVFGIMFGIMLGVVFGVLCTFCLQHLLQGVNLRLLLLPGVDLLVLLPAVKVVCWRLWSMRGCMWQALRGSRRRSRWRVTVRGSPRRTQARTRGAEQASDAVPVTRFAQQHLLRVASSLCLGSG